MIRFTILGKPVPQGSKVAVPIRARGGGYKTQPNGRPICQTVAVNKGDLRAWRDRVAGMCGQAMRADGAGLLAGGVSLSVRLTFQRPAAHYGTGRNAGILKANAPKWPTIRPDSFKLVRAIEDALTGVAWRDDSQVCIHSIRKIYGLTWETEVVIEGLEIEIALEARP